MDLWLGAITAGGSHTEVRAMIVKRSDGYHVVSESKDKKGKRKNLGGPYATREGAKRRLQQVEYFKHKG